MHLMRPPKITAVSFLLVVYETKMSLVYSPCSLNVDRDRLVTLRSKREQSQMRTDPSSEHEAKNV